MEWDDDREMEEWEVELLWDEGWETCNIAWHNDMVTTAQEYDKLELTEQ